MLPVEAVPLLGDDVCYSEEVPVRIRWVIADLGGHTLDDAEVLVTTDLDNEAVAVRLEKGEDLIKAPSLLVHMEPDRELESASGRGADGAEGVDADGIDSAAGDATAAAAAGAASAAGEAGPDYSGGGIVDGEIVGTDDHTAAVAGVRRTARTEVPSSVIDEMEDAVAVMTRALRQGAWEQSQTHASLLAYLREETEELAEVIGSAESGESGESEENIDQQELCKELSDILLQVLFHAEIANRRGSFDIGHVAGAFVAKMRSRAPYLFEDVERPVGVEEQERLWAEGRVAEGKAPYKEAPAVAPAQSTGQPGQGEQSDQADIWGDGAGDPSSSVDSAGAAAPAGAAGAASAAPAAAGAHSAAPAGFSALEAAEQVIALARENGLHDADIPTDIRFPMVGLERDGVGDADNRLFGAVEAFRRELEFRFEPAPSENTAVENTEVENTVVEGDGAVDAETDSAASDDTPSEDSADRWGA